VKRGVQTLASDTDALQIHRHARITVRNEHRYKALSSKARLHRSLEDRQHAIDVGSNAELSITTVLQADSPKIEIAVEPVSGSIERGGSRDARIGIGFADKCRFEIGEILHASCIL
jgi:hypothetical protein